MWTALTIPALASYSLGSQVLSDIFYFFSHQSSPGTGEAEVQELMRHPRPHSTQSRITKRRVFGGMEVMQAVATALDLG